MKKIISVVFCLLIAISLYQPICADASPAVTSATHDNNSQSITVVCSDQNYYNAIAKVYLKDDWSVGLDDQNGNITKDDQNLTFTISTANGIGQNYGNYTLKIVATGYTDYTHNFTVSEVEINTFPQGFSVYFNNDGDLVISVSDQDAGYDAFLNAMVANYDASTNIIRGIGGELRDKGNDKNIPDYFFGVHNGIHERTFTPLKRVNNTVVFSVSDQLNKNDSQVYRGQILNDVPYTLTFEVPGFGKKTLPGKYTFTNANKRIPKHEAEGDIAKADDIDVYLADGYLIVSAKNDSGLNFINNIYAAGLAKFNANGVIENTDTDLVWVGNEVTGDTFDTITPSVKVFSFDSSRINDLNEWQALISATGYGQYCWDGRPFGGTTKLTVNKFSVKRSDGVQDIGSGVISKTASDIVGVYVLPDISPVSGKKVLGWRIKGADGNSIFRCAGEQIFVTANIEIEAHYADGATPEKVNFDDIKTQIVANVVKKIEVASNAFNSKLNNNSFISADDAAIGAAVWVETKALTTGDDYNQITRAINKSGLDNKNSFAVIDINIFKQVGSQSNNPEKIEEVTTEAELTLDLSGTDNATARGLAEQGKLGLFTVHNGKAQDVIRGTYDSNSKTYTFKASKFSVFALVEVSQDLSNVAGYSAGSSKNSYVAPKTCVE